jgi:hypothetical protein
MVIDGITEPALTVADDCGEMVITGACRTVRVKVCAAELPATFVAMIENVYVPPVFAAGVPVMVAVPVPESVKVRSWGSPDEVPVGVKVIFGAGYPVVLTVKVNAAPTVAVAVAALVTVGTEARTRVKLWRAVWIVPPTVLVAVSVIG